MRFFIGLIWLTIALCMHKADAILERVDDTDLVHLLTNEDNVIAMFTKANCPECDELETIVTNIQNELNETMDAVVVKAHESHLVSIYDPSKEPALIYFRRGIPILYYGENSEEEIVRFFSDNREPVVRELADINFEHLTQAATGATTGDWFVFFYSADCIFCQRLYAVWETVGGKLKRTLNVARVNRLEAGISTAKRFGIAASPEFIYLRQGKYYRYNLKVYTPESFIDFVQNGYLKQTHPESVPPPTSILDEAFPAQILSYFGDLSISSVAIAFFVASILLVCIAKRMSKKPTPPPKKATKKTK